MATRDREQDRYYTSAPYTHIRTCQGYAAASRGVGVSGMEDGNVVRVCWLPVSAPNPVEGLVVRIEVVGPR